MKKVMQPHESHMQFIAQWMCDYNLFGCAYMDCKIVKFRWPIPEYLEITSSSHRWHNRTIPAEHISNREHVPRQSHCSIEVDVCVQDILNRLEIKARPIHHDFIERTKTTEPNNKLVNSMAGLWRDETKRRKRRMGLQDTDSSPFPPEVLVSISADPRNSQPGGWIHEEEYRDRINAIVQDEKKQRISSRLNFETFVGEKPFLEKVKSSLFSVEDLYPANLSNIIDQSQNQLLPGNPGQIQMVDMDVARPDSLQEDEFPYYSDEEPVRDSPLHELDFDANAHFPGPVNESNGINGENGKVNVDNADQGPTSSTELESLGIRDSGDYDHIEHDAFEVPAEFSSNIYEQASFRREGQEEPPRKRKKLIKSEMFHDFTEVEQKDTFEIDPRNHRHNGSADLPKLEQSRASKTAEVGANVENPSASMPNSSTSQEISATKARAGKLAFPVVKDPQNPTTLLRLSQKSNSSPKSSQLLTKSSPEKVSANDSMPLSSQISGVFSSTSRGSEAVSSQTRTCASRLSFDFPLISRQHTYCYPFGPPSPKSIMQELANNDLPSKIYQDAFYSEDKDVPDRPREYAGKEYRLESVTVPYLPDFDATGTSLASVGAKESVLVDRARYEKLCERRRDTCSLIAWEIAQSPPARSEVCDWLREQQEGPQKTGKLAQKEDGKDFSQIEMASQKNRHGFKYSQKQKSTSVQHETQYMSIMSLEVHANTRGTLLPNPEYDEIKCAFWCIQSDDEDMLVNGLNEGTHVGLVVLAEGEEDFARKISGTVDVEVDEESSELDLINRLISIVREYDPDILTGYEVHGSSWGYMIERARCKYEFNLCDEFSRMMSQSHGRFGKEEDRWGFNQTSTIRVTGRHTINIWRAMRGELNLLQYTMENVVFQLCHKRIPHYMSQDLTSWYQSGKPKDLAKVMNYYITRVQLDLEILERNELIPRTSEQARLLGVDFFSVFSRGSQFKVESLMFRIAKPENLLLPSPSRKQVGQQNALECLPLVMEPQSAFYNSPLLVLDFQSLYPSIMIAYNYCYSTFLGRVVNWRGKNKMGFTNYHRRPGLLELLDDQINIAPNGIMYAKPEIRKSLLAKMLGEILETRVMVKSGMKVDKDDKTLQRLLNNRQLALKLIANVTYGYTSASFSGRMPCSEIADSIVQTARETLEKAIALIHSVSRWNAEVVYGDTDSLFIYLKGRTKDEAFDIGNEIAKAVTDMNPRPVKLKFEKVYLPSVLLAKKRYVAFKYESKTQKVPDFDAKGIETVRRDGTPAEQKIEEKALKILFRTADLSQVRDYFQRQCSKIMSGRVSIQDFCFAREVKLGTYSDKGLPPPGALISSRKMTVDPRAEPQYGERVPYVVITGAPGARLIDRCVAPEVLLRSDNNELDAEYYISKNLIPPLERIFNLVGANVRQWYDEMPKFQRIRRVDPNTLAADGSLTNARKTLESYMKSSLCVVCREKLEGEAVVCDRCVAASDTSVLALQSKISDMEKRTRCLESICRSCASLSWNDEVRCESKDCPIYYTRIRHEAVSRREKLTALPLIGTMNAGNSKALQW